MDKDRFMKSNYANHDRNLSLGRHEDEYRAILLEMGVSYATIYVPKVRSRHVKNITPTTTAYSHSKSIS